MIFFIFFIYVPLVHSELHRLNTTYTGKNGQTTPGSPEVSAVTTLDGQQIDYYDSEIKKLIPKQDWMKEFASRDVWKDYTEIRERVQQINKLNIPAIMQRFNQPRGVHTYQRMYGCEWDDETGDSRGFDEHGYDGQRFISLDRKKIRYTASVPQARLTVMKWNNDKEQLDILKQYYDYECVYWLKELVHFSRATFKKTSIVPELTGQSLKEPIQKILTEDETNSSRSASDASYIRLIFVIIILVILIMIALCAIWYIWNQIKHHYSKFRYYKENNPTPQGTSTTEDCRQSEQSLIESSESLASSPEEESLSPEEGSSLH
ncbi:hypothetical protein cypCar_00042769 [Cyprinus carpio]|uniref:MHC class I-like antigen recognition-like domain-containing protein n=1 Tax=Cyprinus carpio carpio TaxID=630221 RepID=A0A9J8A5G3_CYPCA|nr:hypothetical protein cypCar_00042769 [Cyprinus carpio]